MSSPRPSVREKEGLTSRSDPFGCLPMVRDIAIFLAARRDVGGAGYSLVLLPTPCAIWPTIGVPKPVV